MQCIINQNTTKGQVQVTTNSISSIKGCTMVQKGENNSQRKSRREGQQKEINKGDGWKQFLLVLEWREMFHSSPESVLMKTCLYAVWRWPHDNSLSRPKEVNDFSVMGCTWEKSHTQSGTITTINLTSDHPRTCVNWIKFLSWSIFYIYRVDHKYTCLVLVLWCMLFLNCVYDANKWQPVGFLQ